MNKNRRELTNIKETIKNYQNKQENKMKCKKKH